MFGVFLFVCLLACLLVLLIPEPENSPDTCSRCPSHLRLGKAASGDTGDFPGEGGDWGKSRPSDK